MRLWKLVVVHNTGEPLQESWLITLTDDTVWSDLRSGTLITISEDLRDNAGEYHPEVGQWWINVRASPETAGIHTTVECVIPSCDPNVVEWKVSNEYWQVTIKDPNGTVIFGPAGEGVAPVAGIGSTEVFKLEVDPSASIEPNSDGYEDGASSSFGQPNIFSAGTMTQDFSVLRSVVPYAPLTSVRIGEVFSHSDPSVDWVELRNTTGTPVDIGGWFLSDRLADLTRYEIPVATSIPANGHAVFDTIQLGFGFSSSCGDEIVLSEADPNGLTGVRDFAEFGAVENGVSFGRENDGEGPFVRLSTVSQGSANAGLLASPVVINEIMYHPPDPNAGITVNPEFVELYNLAGGPVDLFTDFGPKGTHPWRITGGIDFDIPLGTTLPPGGFLVLVGFDPASEPAQLTEFRNLYSLTTSVVILGPYSGRLGNFSDTVRLKKPDTPHSDPNDCGVDAVSSGFFAPQVIVDEVTYFDFGDWPASTDGDGPSLERSNPRGLGDDPANWVANLNGGATPGAKNSPLQEMTKEQRICVEALNKALARIARAQGNGISKCIWDRTKQKLAKDGLTTETCIVADRKQKVAKAEEKTADDFLKKCTGNAKDGTPKYPPFGGTDPNTVNEAGIQEMFDLIHDIFGPDLDLVIQTEAQDKDTARCQRIIAKRISKCQDKKLREFIKCKRDGIKDEIILNPVDLEACMGVDPKGRVAKLCDPLTGKLRNDIDNKCVDKTVDLSDAFPGCTTDLAGELATCLGRQLECRVCLALNQADDIERDCDLFDDHSANLSCP